MPSGQMPNVKVSPEQQGDAQIFDAISFSHIFSPSGYSNDFYTCQQHIAMRFRGRAPRPARATSPWISKRVAHFS